MPRPPAKAQTIADDLVVRVQRGDWPPGAYLPALRDLGAEYAADKDTIARALRHVADRGLVDLIKGNGARVKLHVVARRTPSAMRATVGRYRGFSATLIQAGGEPYTDVKHVDEVDAPVTVARWLGVPTGTTVLDRTRVRGRVAEGGQRVPYEMSTTWIAMAVVDRLPILRQVDTGPGGMTVRMEEAGYELSYYDEATARLASPSEREILEIDERQPVFDVWRRTTDQTGAIVKVSNTQINPLEALLTAEY